MAFTRMPLSAYFRPLALSRIQVARSLTSAAATTHASPPGDTGSSLPLSSEAPPLTHFKITLTRSGISLSKKVQRTLLAMGFHKRFQTVYFPHSPEVAGKILRVKELVHVENVGQDMVMTKQQQRQARKASRGYKVVGSRKGAFMGV